MFDLIRQFPVPELLNMATSPLPGTVAGDQLDVAPQAVLDPLPIQVMLAASVLQTIQSSNSRTEALNDI
jgi:hypothetical protein